MCANPLKTKAVSIVTAERTVNDQAGTPRDERANALVQEPYSSANVRDFSPFPAPYPCARLRPPIQSPGISTVVEKLWRLKEIARIRFP